MLLGFCIIFEPSKSGLLPFATSWCDISKSLVHLSHKVYADSTLGSNIYIYLLKSFTLLCKLYKKADPLK